MFKERLIKGAVCIGILCLLAGVGFGKGKKSVETQGEALNKGTSSNTQQEERKVKIMPMPQRKVFSGTDNTNVQWLKWILGQDEIVVNLDTSTEILNINTGERKRILEAKDSIYGQMSISPDGSNMIFTELIKGEGFNAYIYNLKNKKKELILKGMAGDFNWSPDGRYAIYTFFGKEVYLFDVEKGENKEILKSKFWDPKLVRGEFGDPKWLPKSNKISILTKKGLCIMNINGTGLKKVADNVIVDYQWFPDEKRVCFEKSGELFILNIDKNIQTKIGEFSNMKVMPWPAFSISPDGKKIAYNYGIYEKIEDDPPPRTIQLDSEIYIYDVETKETINITNTPDQWEEFPKWSLDGKKILCIDNIPFFDGKCLRKRSVPLIITYN